MRHHHRQPLDVTVSSFKNFSLRQYPYIYSFVHLENPFWRSADVVCARAQRRPLPHVLATHLHPCSAATPVGLHLVSEIIQFILAFLFVSIIGKSPNVPPDVPLSVHPAHYGPT